MCSRIDMQTHVGESRPIPMQRLKL